MTKIDFKKTIPSYAAKHNAFEAVDVPLMQYLMIDGFGVPDGLEYTNAVSTLYPVAYALKFASKEQGKDYVVPPLQGLWWADDMSAFAEDRRDEWQWTMMIMAPEWIDNEMFDAARKKVAKKHLPAIDLLRIDELHEGLCIQVLHIGSYADEGPILAQLHNEYIPSNGLEMTGKHHEIYLGDPRRVAPERLKTILRQPVQPVG